jgi:hypothetical protein
MTKLFKRIALYPFVILYILLEELVYNAVILPVSDRIKSLQVIQRLNALLARFGRYTILMTVIPPKKKCHPSVESFVCYKQEIFYEEQHDLPMASGVSQIMRR